MRIATNPVDPLTLEALAQVSINTLVPDQQPTPLWLLKKTDCYQQRFLKYPGLAVCHSYPELIHNVLLEKDQAVSAFVPHPFKIHIRGYPKPYIPDCYVVRCGQPQVIEIKSEGDMDKAFNKRVAAFLNWYDMPFSVISNEALLAYEQEARNWLPIIRLLVYAKRMGVDTQPQEYRLLENAHTLTNPVVSDLNDPGMRTANWLDELALNRLIYRHKFEVDLRQSALHWDTELKPCF